MSPLCEISFTEAYRKKLQEIRDVVTGKMKIKELHFNDSEDINENYEKKIENLFETLQKKLLRLDLSEEQSRANIPNEPTEERKVGAAPSTVEVKRFYDGTNYTCNQCAKIVYGDLPFKNHLKTLHNVQSKGLMNILEFSSDHKELSYSSCTCQLPMGMCPVAGVCSDLLSLEGQVYSSRWHLLMVSSSIFNCPNLFFLGSLD